MKIGNPTDKPVAVSPLATGQAAATDLAAKANASAPAAAAAATPSTPDASVTVALSTTASTLLSGGTSAEFDTDKVARISQAITDGTFKVNPEVIADKLISNAHELLSKVQR